MRQYSVVILIIIVIFSFFYINIDFKNENDIESQKINYNLSLEVKNIEKNAEKINIYAENILLKAYVDQNKDVENIISGDVIIFETELKPVEYYAQKYQNKSYSYYLKSKKIDYTGYIKDVKVISHKNDIYSLRWKIVQRMEHYVDGIYKTDAPIYKALLYGDKSELSERVKQEFSHTGTAHLLALSGFHTAVILLFVNLLLKGISVKKRSFISIIILSIYVFITGAKPSIIRAVLFFAIYYASFIFEKKYNLISCASICAALMLSFNPYYLYEIGFQLSFLSILAIASFSLMLKMYKIPSALSITISAQLFTAPVVAYSFGVISLSGSLSNLVIIPLISLDMIMFIFSLIIAPLFNNILFLKPLFIHYIHSIILLKDMIIDINRWFEKLPLSYIDNVSLEIWKIMIYYAIILIIYKLWQRKTIKENLYEFKPLPKIIT